jgi:hypothetical protein
MLHGEREREREREREDGWGARGKIQYKPSPSTTGQYHGGIIKINI